MMSNPMDYQMLQFHDLVRKAKDTEWGKKYGYKDNFSLKTYQNRVPISSYEQIYTYIDRMLKGEQNLLWHSDIEWFSKSSGTTNDRSKFIPVSYEALEDCHNKCGKDMLSILINNFNPDTKVFDGKSLSVGGTHMTNPHNPSTRIGDVSAIFVENLPVWAEFVRAPSKEVFMLSDWEEKIQKMINDTKDENITSLSGVPTWMVVLLQNILTQTGKNNILEIWPNLEVFLHGAVAFAPYEPIFKKLCPGIQYIELYNASEGFFAMKDQPERDDMLLMLDHGVFYEFVAMEDIENEHPKAILLDQVEIGKNYAMVISTNAGLWRYMIGDTVKFTSTYPFRIKITGRTKHFINAFGEEVVIENADKAISEACSYTGASIKDYTAGPVYLSNDGSKGGHEWLIEFEKMPDSTEKFISILDDTLRKINSDYDAKRFGDIALQKPTLTILPTNTFYNWLKTKGKLGGQHKVPRLANHRNYIEEIKKDLYA